MLCKSDAEGHCAVHGGEYDKLIASCQTTNVLLEVREERAYQFARYGTNADLEDGTGPLKEWLVPFSNQPAYEAEGQFRAEYNSHDKPTWMHLLREEFAEAMLEDDPSRLRQELIQVAAVAVSWIERLDQR